MIKLIWAMTESYLIGKGNDLPWNYPEDLKYFKKNTLNKDVLMGLNTYNSIVELFLIYLIVDNSVSLAKTTLSTFRFSKSLTCHKL